MVPIGVFCLLKSQGGILMKGILEMGQAYEVNPYVIQASRISNSLGQLTQIFADSTYVGGNFSQQDVDIIYEKITNESQVLADKYSCEELKVIISGVMGDMDSFGENLSVKNKRVLEKGCQDFELIKSLVGKEFSEIKKMKVQNACIQEEREACLTALQNYAGATKEIAKKLDKSIYEDTRLQKKVKKCLKKIGVKVIKLTVMVSEQGGYEMMLSAKCRQGSCITTEQVGNEISKAIGKKLSPEMNEPMMLGRKYSTLHYLEKPRFNIVHGVSLIAKDGSEKSGDNFLTMDIKGGKKALVISDGMGSGEKAHQMSSKILDAMEALLDSGMGVKSVVTICNSMLVSSQKGMDFGTLDVCVVDTYSGHFEITKAGAASTFILNQSGVKKLVSTSLPVGVMNGCETDTYEGEVGDNTYVVMATDGVLDLLKGEQGEKVIEDIVTKQRTQNPKELSEIILHSILEGNKGVAMDDMMVAVMGCWERKSS